MATMSKGVHRGPICPLRTPLLFFGELPLTFGARLCRYHFMI